VLSNLNGLTVELLATAADQHHAYTTGQPRGPLTGIKPLDRAFGGCLWPGTYIVHGSPGAGKRHLPSKSPQAAVVRRFSFRARCPPWSCFAATWRA
jgi:hypothetical protein